MHLHVQVPWRLFKGRLDVVNKLLDPLGLDKQWYVQYRGLILSRSFSVNKTFLADTYVHQFYAFMTVSTKELT